MAIHKSEDAIKDEDILERSQLAHYYAATSWAALLFVSAKRGTAPLENSPAPLLTSEDMSEGSKAPSKAEPKWKFIERTVAVLEHMLAPGAIVQHDQALNELVSGIQRQCDVIVRYGALPRQTLAAIVEVQDRVGKVGLQDFEAWCAKREKLGAQRLICVSSEGFTAEVEIAAKSMGDIVSLMTLCEPEERPSFFAGTAFISHMQVLHYRDGKVTFHEKMPNTVGTVGDDVFEFPEGGPKVSLQSLATHALRRGLAKDVQRCPVDDKFFDLKYRVEFAAAGTPLLFRQNAETYTVWEANFSDRIEEVHQSLESTPLAYEQRNVNGELAFVLFGKGSYEGKNFYTQQSFLKQQDGSFRPGPPTMSKMEGLVNEALFVELIMPTKAIVPAKRNTDGRVAQPSALSKNTSN